MLILVILLMRVGYMSNDFMSAQLFNSNLFLMPQYSTTLSEVLIA